MSMLSSPRRLRKADVLVLFIRMRLSLCWTSGWSMTWTRPGIRVLSLLAVGECPDSHHGAVAVDAQGRRAAPPLVGEAAAGGPGPAFQDSRQRHRARGGAQAGAHPWRGAVRAGPR